MHGQLFVCVSQEDDEKKRSTEMYSLSENVAKKVLKKTPLDFISFNRGQTFTCCVR